MACRRRHGISKSSTFKEEMQHPESDPSKPKLTASHTFTSVDAIRAPASHRPSSGSPLRFNKVFDAYEDNSPRSPSNTIWDALTRKAKTILEEDDAPADVNVHHKTDDDVDDHHRRHDHNDDNVNIVVSPRSPITPTTSRFELSTTAISMAPPPTIHQHSYSSPDGLVKKMDNNHKVIITSPVFRKNDGNNKARESPRKLVLQTPAASSSPTSRNDNNNNKIGVAVDPLQLVRPNLVLQSSQQRMHSHTNHMNPETQLKASRDVAMATAAKAKLLLRELKTVKADLAFAKQRSSQLEQENALLRESRDKGTGNNPADDELIRLQLETLLAEKARLANENAFYARENCYLREIVEYHQLTLMHHDMVYLDDDYEDYEEEGEEEGGGDQEVVVYPAANMNMSPPPLSPITPPASPHYNSTTSTTSTNPNIAALNNDDQQHVQAAAVSNSTSSASATDHHQASNHSSTGQ